MTRTQRLRNLRWALLLPLVAASATIAEAAYLTNVPQVVVQPDGDTLRCFASGDEYYNWLHDVDGYTILQDPVTGYFVYAKKKLGRLVSSGLVAGRSDPAAAGIETSLRISPEQALALRTTFLQATPGPSINAPRTGLLNNIVVFIRFSGEAEFSTLSSTYNAMFNTSSLGANSMYNYFREASYSQLSVTTTMYPPPANGYVVSFQDAQSRAYYQPYNATTNLIGYTGGDNGTDRRNREHILLQNAIASVQSQVPADINLDEDGDGNVDNVCFIIYGSPTGWSSLLWPHMWSLYSRVVTLNGKRVYTYNFQLQSSLGSSGVGVLCHEMCHSLGAPDLYHYVSDGMQPVGIWDVMAVNANPPQHMCAYLKLHYMNWTGDIPFVNASGTYKLAPLTSHSGHAMCISSPVSASEYFLVEYRKRLGTFEASLPHEGLLVYRINTLAKGNASGPPDEIYCYRPGGTTTTNGSYTSAPYSANTGRTEISDFTSPSSFLSSGAPGGLSISNIGSIGDSISFSVRLPGIQTITGPQCPLNEWDSIAVDVIAPVSGDFHVEVIDGDEDGGNPLWQFTRFLSEEVTLTGLDVHRFHFRVRPTTPSQLLLFTLCRKVPDGSYAGSQPWYQTLQLPPCVSVTTMLEGAYTLPDGMMSNSLNAGGVLAAHFVNKVIPADAVDSISIEIRDSASAVNSTMQHFAPAWLLRDGSIRSFDDTSKSYIAFDGLNVPYYVAVHHRNHLPIMSRLPMLLQGGVSYNFSTGPEMAFGEQAMKQLATGVYGMTAGDADGSGDVSALDRTATWNIRNQTGYLRADVDLSGSVDAIDRTIVWNNRNLSTKVP
jgi:M6 family metalloprotease-like protein